MDNKTYLNEKELIACDVDNILPIIHVLGFRTAEELLNMRVFDLLNLNTIDRPRAEGILYCLYLYFNGNEAVDEGIQDGSIKQYFDYRKWKRRRTYDKAKVKDLILADNINAAAINHLLNLICKAFYRSPEYNWKEYRYQDVYDYRRSIEKEEK